MISSKSEFLKLWDAGRLGNKLRTWPSLGDAAGYDGLFSIRDGRANSNLCRYNVTREGVPRALAEMGALGGRDLYLGEMAPDHRLLVQGEFFEGGDGGAVYNRCLTYSTEQTQMKRVKRWTHVDGAAAMSILRSYLSPGSFDDFQALREQFPGHVVEFGAYEQHLGNMPGRNTIIWEVRSY